MSLTAALPDQRPAPRFPGWPFWLANGVAAPIATAVALFFLLSGPFDGGSPYHVIPAVSGVALLLAAAYALSVWSHGVSVRRAVGGYVLAAVLTIPWGYTLLIGGMVVACGAGYGCPS